MVNKVLGRMEALKGFIQIPVESRGELIGDLLTPCKTLVNDKPARLDTYGRLWSPSLKGKFPAGSLVEISKTEQGYQVKPAVTKHEGTVSTVEQIKETESDITFPTTIQGEKSDAEILPLSITQKPYFQAGQICIYNDDILTINDIQNGSIDLIMTSPPYDVDIKYENYDDSIPYDEYLEFTRKWLAKCYDLAKPDGRLCLNIPLDKNKGGQQSVCADITTIAKEVGWRYHSTVIWNEQNISRRTAWGSWMSASAPFVIAPVEVIVVLYKKTWEKTRKGKSDITRDEFIEWTNGVWNFSGESRSRIGHPSPFPVELPKRCMKLFSFVGDTVLDPFLGSGTTLIACLETNRAGIGVEINRNYCELAVRRLQRHGISYQKMLDETPQTSSLNMDKF